MNCNRFIFLFLITALFGSIAAGQATKQSIVHEQTVFGSDDDKWDRPVPVQEAVLQILKEANHASASEFSAGSLLASEIRLNGPKEVDLVLMGIGKLGLAHAALFWIFRNTSQGYKLVLSPGGDSLRILDSRWNHFQMVKVQNNTAITTTTAAYRFNGREYQLYSKKTKPIE